MFSSKRDRSGAELLPGPDEVFTERLNVLASTVSATAASLAKTDGDVAGLRRELGDGLARIEELVAEMRSHARAGDVRELEKKVASLSVERAKTSETKRLDDIGSKIAVLTQRLDTLASTVATTAAGAAGRDGEIAALRRQLGEVPRGPGVDEALLRRVESAAAASASASLRVESYGEAITELASRLESVEERLSELTSQVESDEKERISLATSVADAAAARWMENERALTALVERVGAVEERNAAIASELTRATSLLPAAFGSLEARVDELAGARRAIEEDRPRSSETNVLGALRTLEQRMQQAELAAREEREAILDRLERLGGRFDGRSEPLPAEADGAPLQRAYT
jgi:chromosome segregation ATPase